MDFQLSVNNGNLEHKACWYRGGFIGALRLLEMTGQNSRVLKRICDQFLQGLLGKVGARESWILMKI